MERDRREKAGRYAYAAIQSSAGLLGHPAEQAGIGLPVPLPLRAVSSSSAEGKLRTLAMGGVGALAAD